MASVRRRRTGWDRLVALALSALALALVALPSGEADAQQVTSPAVLHRDTIVEGQTRAFQISNVPTRPEYYLHASVGGSFSAEASDVTITTNNLLGQALTVTPDANGPRAYPDSVYSRIRFEVTANADGDGAGDETFGIRLCTTADCSGGAVLGEWTVTITEPQADTTLSGTGATLTIAGGSALSVMEDTANGDGRDRRATFSIDVTTAPTSDIAIVAYTETGVSTGTRMAPFARINSALSPDYPPHGETGHNNVRAEYLVGYWASGATGSQDFTIISTDNAVDSAGGTITGNLKFKLYVDNEAFRTTLSGTSSDTAYGNATAYTAIAIPDLPVRVTDDDEPTRIRLLPTSPADNTATEGASDKATVLVRLDRALVAGEEVTALLTFGGAALGTNFSLAAQSGQTGVSYADSAGGAQGLVTLAGAGVQEGVIEVTALTDTDSDTQTLQIGMPPNDQPWRANYLRSNLDGGVCAAHGCPDRPQGDPGQRFQSVTLAEAVPGLTITEHADPDARVVTEGMDYSYTLQLNSAPSNAVTVTTTIASGGSVQAGGTLTFTSSNHAMPQTVTVRPTGNSTDEPRRTLTVTHAFSGDTTYAALSNVTHEVTVLDDDATTVTMAGAGVRDPARSATSANISRIMVEGDATRVDRTLTITLSRALVDGEYVRVPLRVEAVANGNDPSLPDDPPDSEDGDPPLPGDLDHRRTTVDSARGPRASANVAWPPIHNDVVMTATGTGITYEHSNRHTPNHIGFRYIEFRGAGAQTATIVIHAQDGFDDGETYDEAFSITFPHNFHVFDGDTDQPLTSSPVDSNLGGGVTAAPVDGEAWFGIDDDDKPPPVAINAEPVPHTSPLVPDGLSVGDTFRLLFVTRGETAATTGGTGARAHYDNFVRAEITGNQLKQGGVSDLMTHASKFVALITTNDGNNDGAEDAGMFRPHHFGSPPLLPDVPIYWVGGNKIADDRDDFTDGDWDDEMNPTFADGSAATIHTDGYWTGSKWHGGRRGGAESDCAGGFLRAGESHVNVGKLNDGTLGPMGPDNAYNGCDHAQPSGELRPLFAMTSSVFVITGPTVAVENSEAAEGSPVQFTVTLSETLSNAVNVPYTLTDGRGDNNDPAHFSATGASGGTGADYDNDAGTITIAAGATTGTISITTTGDTTYEGDHYFTVTLGTPTGTDPPGLEPNKSTAIGTITDAADRPTFQFAPATGRGSEATGTAELTITKSGTTLVPSSVTWTTADGTGASAASHPGDYTSATGTLQFAPGDASKTISIAITADSTAESAETFNVQLSDPVEATLGSAATATVTVTDADTAPPPTVNVAIAASDGDSDGNPVEGGSGAAGYKTITVTLSRALTSGQWMQVKLNVQGATVTDDYTIDLHPSSQTGVQLLASGSDGSQNPTVQFFGNSDGTQTATLRLTPVQNNRRSQPAVSISAAISFFNGVTAGEVTGGPIVFSIVDDESGVIEVPATFGLAPAGLSAGDRFRLIFVTSETRTAESADIDDYNSWVQGVVARGGHAELLPYGGLVKVIGSTASVDARENTGMWDPDANSGSGGYEDGSTSASDSGVAVYWLAAPSSDKVADNYFDFFDGSWDGGHDQSQEDTNEAGNAHPTIRTFFTGTEADGTVVSGNGLGASQVQNGASDSNNGNVPIAGDGLISGSGADEFIAISPVFELQAAVIPVLSFTAATYSLAEDHRDGGVHIVVTASTAPTSGLTVNLSSADGTATDGEDYTAPSATFTFPSGQTRHQFLVPFINDNTDEGDETFTLTLTAASDGSYTLGSPAATTVTIVDDDEPPVTVTMSATDGDADGNAVENGAGTTGYRTITITLGRALTGAETVTVPLTVQGATVADDYTFGLQPATQTGVTLLNSGATYTAQNPALRFVSGGASATLRLRPVNDSDREQPYAVVGFGTDSRAPSGVNVTVGAVSGGPIGIVLVDDETGAIEVPSSWGLVPASGVGAGDDFRLLFRTSTGRDATSTDIADYDAFIRGVLATGGHADILPYAGFFKVFGSTRSGSGSTGATARFHNGLVTTGEHNDHHDQAGDVWADGSARSGRGATDPGTPVYWLNGVRIANNYADLCDISWTGSGAGVRDGFDRDDPRSEDGTRNVPAGTLTTPRLYEPWTGSGNTCEAWNHPLGASAVSRGGHSASNTLLHATTAANTQIRPLYGMSPVFTVEGATAELSVSASGTVTEGGTLMVTVTLSRNADANLSIPVRMRTSGAPTASAADFTLSNSGSVAITSGTSSGTLTFSATDDRIDEDAETLVLEFGALPAGVIAGTSDSVAITINDNDTHGVTVTQTGGDTVVAENGGTDTYTVALNTQPLTNVVITLTSGTPAAALLSAGTQSNQATVTLTFTPSAWGAQTVTVRGVNDNVDNANDRRDVTITQAVTTGDTGGKYTTSTPVANVSVRVNDDDTAAVTVTPSGGTTTVNEDQSDTDDYTVALATQPLRNVTITATAPAGTQVSDDGGSTWGSSVDLVFTSGTSGNWGTAQTVTVRGDDDNIDNPGDQRAVTITHAITSGNGDGSRYTPTTPSIAGVPVTVTDDDAAPSIIRLGVDTATVGEEDGATSITVTATVVGATRFGVEQEVAVTVTPLPAVIGVNYVDMAAVSPFTITIPAGAQSATEMFTLTPVNNVVDETDQTLTVSGSVMGAGTLRFVQATITLTDDDATPTSITLSVNPTSITENGGARNIAVTARVDGGTTFGTNVPVTVAVAGHNAEGRVNFTAASSLNINIPAEASSSAAVNFPLTPTNNNWDERNGAAAFSGSTLGATVNGASVTITDDDAAPTGVALSVNRSTIAEGAGATSVTVTATVQGSTRYGSAKTVTVSQMGSGDSNVVDYTATSPSAISIAAGAATGTTSFTITPADDAADEFNETVTVSGSGAGVASVSEASITLTDNDDTTLTISAPAGGIAENGGTKDVTLTLSRALVSGETVTVPLEVVGVTATDDYTVALQPTSQTGVALSQSGPDSAQRPQVTLGSGAQAAVLRFTAADDALRQQPYAVVRYGTGARAPSGTGVDFAAPTDGPVGFVLTDDETGDIGVSPGWGLLPSQTATFRLDFRLAFVTSGQRDASSGDIADYDHFIRLHLAEGHPDIVPYAGFFTALGSTSGVTLQNHADVTGSTSMDFFWLGETGTTGERRLAASNDTFRAEWFTGSTPSQQSVPRDESGTLVSPAANGYFTGSTAAGARSANPLGSANVTLGYLNDSGAGRAPLGSGQTASGTATRSFYGLSPVFSYSGDPAITISSQATSVTEGTAITLTITAERAPTADLPINLVVGDGGHVVPPAATGIKNGAATILANTTSVTYTVNTSADSTDEPDTEVTVGIISGSNYIVSATMHTAVVTVEDNDAMTVSVSGGGGTVNEGSSTDYTVDPGRSLASGETVTVNFAPAGSATQRTDYAISCHGAGVTCTGLGGTTPAMTIRGGANVRRGTIRVSARTDSVHPESETAGISLRSGHGSTGSGGAFSVSGTPSTFTIGSIAPAAITASFGSATYTGTEASGSRTVTIPVSLSAAAPSGGLSVAYAAHSSGTAASADYGVSPAGSVSIAQGTSSASITVTITDDALHEGAETIVLDISGGSGYSPGATARTTVTITDDDPAPTTVALSVDDDAVGEGEGAQTITVTATVGGSTRWGTAQTVAVSVAGSGGQGVVGFTAQPATFNISIAAGAQTGTGTFTLTPQDDNTVENAETVTVSGTLGGATVSPATITLTDDDTAPATPVTVTLSASGGDADGNAVEGASGATGYRTITVTLGRALTGAETVTVPLTVVGATVTTDYAFALQPSSQAGVTLLTSNPHSAQNPALRFAAGASSATLRLTPVNNSARTQPYVVIAYGTSSRAPSGNGVTLGTVTGGPIGVVLVDDETGDVTVPASWGLKPSALGAGDDFRLLFRSSTARDATSTDIADYDAFIRDVVATMGHADVLPYAGFFQVFGATRSSAGSTGTTARVHTGMAAEHTGHVPSGGWADGSAAGSVGDASVGTPIYWLNGDILANNYADLCDQALSSGSGVTTGWGITDPRSEDGTQNNPNSPGQAQQAWTGSGNACEAYDYPLGNSPNVSRGSSHETTWAFLHQAHGPRAEQRPLYGMSPVFRVAGSTAAIAVGFERAHSNVREGTTLQATLTAASASSSSATFTVSATAGTATSGDWSGGPWTVTLPANQTSVSFNVVIPSDTTIEGPERFTLTIASPPQGFTLGTGAATVQIVDVHVVPGDWALIPAGLATGQQFRLVFLGDPHPASGGDIATYDGWVRADASSSGTTPTPHAAIQAYSAGFQMVGSTAAADAAAHTATGISESGAYAHTAWTTPVYWLGGAKIADDHNDFWDGSWDSQLANQTRGPDGQAVSGASRTWTGTQTGATHATAGTASANPLGHTGSNVTQGRWGQGNNPISQGTEGKTNVRRILAISQVFEVGAAPQTPVADFAAATSSVGEASGTTNIRLNLSPAPASAITVNYTLSGTATRGTDYTISGGSGASRTVSVPGGSTFVHIPVTVTNDNAQESAETVVLTLNNGTGYSVGTTNAVHTRTISDDDGGGGTPIASFAAATSSVGEASGTTNLVVNFNPAPSSAITLRYQLSGTATLDADYTVSGGAGTSRALSVSGGTSSVNIPIAITNDSARESAETIIVTLLSSSQYARNEPLIHTRTINDDDGGTTPPPVVVPPPVVTPPGGGGGGGGGPTGPTPSDADFEWNVKRDIESLAGGHDSPTGAWGDGETLWVAQNGSGAADAVHAYDLETGERVTEREFPLDERNRAPRGLASDGETMWVSDSGRDRLFAYDLATGERLPERDIELAAGNRDVRGIWSDGATLWALNRNASLYAYDLASGELLAEYALAARNGDPRGIWSDGVTAWVSDHGAKLLFAYRLPALPAEGEALPEEPPVLERVREEEFGELSRASNLSPRGVWSDRDLMYVADAHDGKVYTYNMPPAIDARLASLTLSGVDFGEFASLRTAYEGVPEAGAAAYTVEAVPVRDGATVRVEPADADPGRRGHQVARGAPAVSVTVTSPDGSRTLVYRVRVRVELPEACLDGAVAEGFSLVVFAGGTIDELAACAALRHVDALYTLSGGRWLTFIPEAPDFVNAPFAEHFGGAAVPPGTPLVAASEGPATEDPLPPADGPRAWGADCLAGERGPRFGLVRFQGGSLEELAACAGASDVVSLWTIAEGEYVAFVPGAPAFVNAAFSALFTGGIPAGEPLLVRVAEPPAPAEEEAGDGNKGAESGDGATGDDNVAGDADGGAGAADAEAGDDAAADDNVAGDADDGAASGDGAGAASAEAGDDGAAADDNVVGTAGGGADAGAGDGASLSLATTRGSQDAPGTPQIVSLSGYPDAPELGALGTGTPAEIAAEAALWAERHDALNGTRGAVPAYHLLVAVAQADPTPDGTWLGRPLDEIIARYVEAARAHGLLLFLEIQVGWSDPLAEARLLEPFLAEPFVHLALDPEFATGRLQLAPGAAVGSVTAEDLNAVQRYLAALASEHGLPPKILIVHQFEEGMIEDIGAIEAHAAVALSISMSAIGGPDDKRDRYERFALARPSERPALKLSLDHDTPTMTPADIQNLDRPPDIVIYQ